MISTLLVTVVLVAPGAPVAVQPQDVRYQAHRGGINEVPENTLAAFRHAWKCPGAVPETDVCRTQDGVFVCMHDDTPKRTTNAPEAFQNKPISEIPFAELRTWDAGGWFNAQYAGEKVPTLREIFEEMKGHPDREIYLDLKDIDLGQLLALIDEYGLRDKVIFVHGDPKMCVTLSELYPGARTMTWLSGSPERIKQRFEELAKTGFKGISQLQLHLKTLGTPAPTSATLGTPSPNSAEIQYVFDADYLRYAREKTAAAGVELQLRPFDFHKKSLDKLLALGIRWYVTDAPRKFSETLFGINGDGHE